MSFKTTIIAAGALIAAGAATVPAAQAHSVGFGLQFGTPNVDIHFRAPYRGPGWHRQALSPHEIRRALRYQGFRQIRFVDRRGPVYVVRAVAHNGRAYTVRVSAYNGQILARHAVGGRYQDRRHWGGGQYGGYPGGWRY